MIFNFFSQSVLTSDFIVVLAYVWSICVCTLHLRVVVFCVVYVVNLINYIIKYTFASNGPRFFLFFKGHVNFSKTS